MSGGSPSDELEALASVRDLRVVAAVSSGRRGLGCEVSTAAADYGGLCSNGIPSSCLFSNPNLHVRFPAESNGPGPHLTSRRFTIGWDGRLLCPREDAPSAFWLCLGAHNSTFHPHLATDRESPQ